MVLPDNGRTIFLFLNGDLYLKGTNTLGKSERLKSRKLTESLFGGGKSFSVYPIKVVYLFTSQPDWRFPVQAGFSASGRLFKKSVDRNRIKRLLRETYRVQKGTLYQTCSQQAVQLAVFFLYTGKELPNYQPLHQKMQQALVKLTDAALLSAENPIH